ncbi:hypothetical protein [Luteolibacter sp. LG18]|uniref:hypothetical protein n=1 Tax=Luteolibacter sp. LG18 TaxID=2819286 RepID=UPI002B3228DF|nr:hypothetical protein llg_21670 [Luteolibacter sp. LG18]
MVKRFISLLLFLFTASAPAAEPVKPEVDKLIDPDTQEAEIRRVLALPEAETLTSYRLHWSPQLKGAPPLIVLAANSQSDTTPAAPLPGSSLTPIDEDHEAGKIPGLSRPRLAPLAGAKVRVFDREGNTPDAWKRLPPLIEGHLCDFNNDDTLDLACIETKAVQVEGRAYHLSYATVTTIEAEPRILTRIAFDCRPDDPAPADAWTLTCDQWNQEGVPVLSFGPSNARTDRERRQFLVHWDPAKKDFTILQAPDDETSRRHLHLLAPAEPLEKTAAQLSKKGR